MRVHAIQTGVVAVKSRQRKGEGTGFRRQLNTLADQTWTDWLPIYCWVIEHPEGLIVVDTGETCSASNPSYFPRWHPYFRFGVKMRVEPEQEVGPQIKRLGLSPNDVKWVIMTHLHTDHAGGISHFPRSKFLVSRKEYQLSTGLIGKIRGYLPDRMPHWFAPQLLDYTDGDYTAFLKGYTVTKSKDVFIVPTPGHTLGHQSVVLRDGEMTYIFAGDTSYTEELMVNGVVDGVAPNGKLAHETILRIQTFLRTEPAVYLPSHDPMSSERMVHQIRTGLPLKLQRRWEMSMDKVTSLINEFDYLDVMSHAPDDEYEVEIRLIKELLVDTTDPHQLAEGIQKVFFNNCGEQHNYNKYRFEDFLVLSKKLLSD